jgi:hypothetical protein
MARMLGGSPKTLLMNHPHALVLLAVGLPALGCRAAEQPSRLYGTQSEAVAAGEASRGWLPVWVPVAATELHIQGDLDTNERWLRFRLPDSVGHALRGHLLLVPDSALPRLAKQRPAGASWWFQNLIQTAPADDGALNAIVYQGAGPVVPPGAYLAFDQTSDLVYLWWEVN